MCVIGGHYRAVGVNRAVLRHNSVSGVDMAEQVCLELKVGEPFEYFFGTVIDIIVKVQYAVGRRMSYQYIGVTRYFGIVATLTVSDAIAHKHRHAIEFKPVQLNPGIAQIMHIIIESVDIRSVQAVVVIAAYKNFVAIWQIAKPVEEIERFLFATYHAEIA